MFLELVAAVSASIVMTHDAQDVDPALLRKAIAALSAVMRTAEVQIVSAAGDESEEDKVRQRPFPQDRSLLPPIIVYAF